MDNLKLNALKDRVENYYQTEDTVDAIVMVEEEIDEIVNQNFDETHIDKDVVMEGDAEIHFPKGHGFMILTDEGEKMFMYGQSYKGSCKEKGTQADP